MTLYELLGGEDGVRALANRFYDEMDRRPEVATLRAMHPADLSTTRERFFWFLSGWLGGPQLFVERVGHPRLRARHFPFAVDAAARDEWMLCMRSALAPAGLEADVLEKLDAAFAQLANHMINRG